MGFKIGDRVEVNYPVDDFQGHVGIVKKNYNRHRTNSWENACYMLLGIFRQGNSLL